MNKLLVFILVLFAVSGCKSTPDYLNTKSLVTNYQTVGLVSFDVPEGLEYFAPKLKQFYKPRIETELEKAGFKTVDASSFYKRLKELKKETPDLYNSNTGQINEALYDQLYNQALRETKEKLNVDIFLFAGIDITQAHFSNNFLLGYTADWYGQSEDFLEDGVDAGDVLGSFFVEKTGHLPGAYIYLSFKDTEYKDLSFVGGGIELLARFDDDGNAKMKTVEYLFDDEAQLANALDLAFTHLANIKQRKK